MNVGVIGAGSWGTTLAALASQRAPTRLWAREPEVVERIHNHHENHLFLPGMSLPEQLEATNDLEQAVAGVDLVVVAVPSQYLRRAAEAAKPFVPTGATILSVTKGIEVGSNNRMTEVL